MEQALVVRERILSQIREALIRSVVLTATVEVKLLEYMAQASVSDLKAALNWARGL